MLNTARAGELHSNSLRCRLGFHRWARAENELGETVYMCLRCGHLDSADDTNVVWSAFSYFSGGPRGPLP